tara:strand:+ start:110 stop:799 length:690 start_codon:yes stop_codon:yes gene_type:complete
MANEQTSVPLYAASEILTAANMNISAGTGVPVFATTVTRDAAFGGAGEKVLAEGQLCYLSSTNVVQYYDGAAWATVGPSTAAVSIFSVSQASGTNGGTATSGSFIKIGLNTTVVNGITSCTLTSGVISLPAGTYTVSASNPFCGVNDCKIKLRNTTDSTDEIIGTAGSQSGTATQTIRTELLGVFTSTATKNYELQYRVSATLASYGLGINNSFSVAENYALITITKTA